MTGELITHVRHYLRFWLLNLRMRAGWFFKFWPSNMQVTLVIFYLKSAKALLMTSAL